MLDFPGRTACPRQTGSICSSKFARPFNTRIKRASSTGRSSRSAIRQKGNKEQDNAYTHSPSARTRKKPAESERGKVEPDWELVSNGCQSDGLNAPARSITNGGEPPVQFNTTFGSLRRIVTVMPCVTVITTASYATACTPSSALN